MDPKRTFLISIKWLKRVQRLEVLNNCSPPRFRSSQCAWRGELPDFEEKKVSSRWNTQSVCIASNCLPETQAEVCWIPVGSFTNCTVLVPLWSCLSWRLHKKCIFNSISSWDELVSSEQQRDLTRRSARGIQNIKEKDFSTRWLLWDCNVTADSWHELHTPRSEYLILFQDEDCLWR